MISTSRNLSLSMFVGIGAGVCVLDQVTKWIALESLPALSSVPVIPHIFHLSLVHNPGVAFGLFQNFPHGLKWLISLSVLLLTFGFTWMAKEPPIRKIAFAFVWGGAVGNWIDRMRLGAVTDFLDFRIWPVFNVADSFITVGVLLFVWSYLKRPPCTPR